MVSSHQKERWLPFVYNQHPGDEVFGLLRRICELRLVKVPLTGQDVVQGLVVIVTKEGAETTQTSRENRTVVYNLVADLCFYVCLRVYSQHVSDDAEAPHVRVEGHKVVVDDLGSEKLWGAKVHPQFLLRFIPTRGIQSTLTTLWLITEGSNVKLHDGTYTLARPKSMILILFVTLFTQRMFSGWMHKKQKQQRFSRFHWPGFEKWQIWLTAYLEVQVQDVHLVHVLQALADLPDEHHGIQLH